MNLITDTLPALSLGVDPEDPDVMKEKPRHAKESLFSGGVPFLIFNGVIIGLLTLIAFIAGAKFYTGDTNLFPLFPSELMTMLYYTLKRWHLSFLVFLSSFIHLTCVQERNQFFNWDLYK